METAFTLASAILVWVLTIFFAIWISVLEKRIQRLADQQEEYWLRHLEDHPKWE